MKAQIEEQKDDIKQLEGALEIMTEIGSQELREKFVEMLNDGREAKRQVCASIWMISLHATIHSCLPPTTHPPPSAFPCFLESSMMWVTELM